MEPVIVEVIGLLLEVIIQGINGSGTHIITFIIDVIYILCKLRSLDLIEDADL